MLQKLCVFWPASYSFWGCFCWRRFSTGRPRHSGIRENVDGTRIMVLFLGIVLIAVVIGTTVAITVVPAIGESVGSFFYNPDEKIEKDSHADCPGQDRPRRL